ncbi:MAG: bifunctional nuclease domain-containing protein [Deltaproteobacteria bacterium]
MKKIKLEIIALSHSITHSHNYAIILGESEGTKRLPVVIGGFEAQSIAVALENMIPTRPLTHDLFKNTLEAFNISLLEVIINQLIEGVFYSKLVFMREGKEYQIDSRTSDAIAMAVRYNAPIYTYSSIIEIAGVEMDDTFISDKPGKSDASVQETKSKSLTEMTNSALKAMLDKALEREDYEKAAQIRDEMKKRNIE